MVSQSSDTHSFGRRRIEHEAERGVTQVVQQPLAFERRHQRVRQEKPGASSQPRPACKRWRNSALKRFTTPSVSLSRSRSRLLSLSTSMPPRDRLAGVQLVQPGLELQPHEEVQAVHQFARPGRAAACPSPPGPRCGPPCWWPAGAAPAPWLRTPCTSGKMPAFLRSSCCVRRVASASRRFHQPLPCCRRN